MKKLICFICVISCFRAATAQLHEIKGRITDLQTSNALPGATVTIKGGSASVSANHEGYFILSKLHAGNIILVISYVGYENLELAVTVKDNATTVADAALTLVYKPGNEIVISASKRPEKLTNAPASIHVIGKKELEQFSGSNVHELLSKVQGLEFVRTGVDYIAINARGFNRAANNKVFQMVDGRNSMTTISTGLPLYNNASVNKEDIESIEIILGPQAALYGPNVHNALFYTTTKDPRKYQGTTLAVSAGNQYQFSARLRQATKINNKWAYKLTGEYAAGKEFVFYDSVYAGGSMYGPAVAIPERNVDFDFRHIRGEAHVYYSVTPKADIIISGGGSNNNFLGVTNGGRNQMRGIKIGFLQARLVHPNFFVNIYNTWGNIGTSYAISSYTRDFWNRTHSTITSGALYPTQGRLPPDSAELFALRLGNQFKEQNQRINAEAQYNYSFQKTGLFLVAGLSYQKEKPNSFGFSLIDKDRRIYVTQTGVVLQLEKILPWGMRFIGAARFDNHSNFGNFFSPKLALTKRIGESNFRITWGKAYSMPSIFFQSANTSGFTFGNGTGIRYIPNQSKFSETTSVKSTTALKPEEISTWEIGYKGTIVKKLYVDINYYNGLSKNFLSPPQSIGGRTLAVGDIPVTHNPAFAGTVVNDTLKNATFNTFFNYGDVKAYGLDVGLNYYFSAKVSLAVNYSWFGSDITKDNIKNDANNDGYVSAEEKSLNAPKNRGVVILSFQNLCKQKMIVNISARFVEQYDFYSGNQIGTAEGKGKRGLVYRGPNLPQLIKNFDWGPLGGFTTIELSAGYKLNNMINLNMGITNVFNAKQIEFVGSPFIGRLFMFEIRVHIPNGTQK